MQACSETCFAYLRTRIIVGLPNITNNRMVLVVKKKNLPPNAGDTRDVGSVSGSGRSPGGGHGNSPRYSCLENPMDRGAWRATVRRVTQSQIPLSNWADTQHMIFRTYQRKRKGRRRLHSAKDTDIVLMPEFVHDIKKKSLQDLWMYIWKVRI